MNTRKFILALDAVKAGQDIEAVATAYHIPRFFLEGEPLPPHYFVSGQLRVWVWCK